MTICNNALCPMSNNCARHEKHFETEAYLLAIEHAKKMWGEHIDITDENASDTRGNLCMKDFMNGFEIAKQKYCITKHHMFTIISRRYACKSFLYKTISENGE